MFQYQFMRYAFLAILMISPLLSLLGTMVVHKKMAYFSDALGHSALTGIAFGVVLGMEDTTPAMLIFAVVFALVLNLIRFKNPAQTDTVISVCASASLAVGLAILSRGGSFSNYSAILVGDVLSITAKELITLAVLFAIVLVYWFLEVNHLAAVSLSATLAKSRGIKARLIEQIFGILIALVVMLSIQWVGILLINALFILPAAASRNISENMREYHLYAIIFSLVSGILGLILSYYVDVATGPMIVIFSAVIYLVTYVYGRKLH